MDIAFLPYSSKITISSPASTPKLLIIFSYCICNTFASSSSLSKCVIHKRICFVAIHDHVVRAFHQIAAKSRTQFAEMLLASIFFQTIYQASLTVCSPLSSLLAKLWNIQFNGFGICFTNRSAASDKGVCPYIISASNDWSAAFNNLSCLGLSLYLLAYENPKRCWQQRLTLHQIFLPYALSLSMR